MIDFEGDRAIDQVAGRLRIHPGAEDKGLTDHRVVDRYHARSGVGAVRQAADVVRAEQPAALITVQHFQATTPVQQRPPGLSAIGDMIIPPYG